MSGFKQMLADIRREAKNEPDLGRRFEDLMVQYFKNDKQFDWKDVRIYPKKDYGIDILATDRFGEQWAIQCKCYKDDSVLHYEGGVTNLWPAADAENIPNKIIVTTATPSRVLDRQCVKTGTRIIRYADLESANIEWDIDPNKIRASGPRGLYHYQDVALKDCMNGFETKDRGQLIMACGTGKTMTALHIVERQAGRGGLVLYLVPSISLVKQTVKEWSSNANIPHQYMIVCSDSTVKDREDISVTDLAGSVTTNPAKLREQYDKTDKNAIRVVLSTYQSAGIVQQAFAGKTFDIIVFDEAHRTAGSEGKNFGLAHHDDNISAKKRLYMTATPRKYKREGDADAYSMDNETIYGKEFHNLKFSTAIDMGILSDYKVVGLSVLAEDLDKSRARAGEDAEFTLEEECKLASIYGAIQQQEKDEGPNLLRRVLVFHNKINQSVRFETAFPKIVKRVDKGGGPIVEVRHVDGKNRAKDRTRMVNWLKNEDAGSELDGVAVEPDVRMITNVRCLSEGVDVPALDGVVFYEPRQSVVDVIQAVGRVMRRSPGKKNGYVIVPVVASRNEAIQNVIDRDKSNKLILQIADALRAHDDRIDRFFNQAALYDDAGKSDRKTENDMPIPPQIAEIFDVLPATLLDTGFYWDEYGRKLGEKAAVVALQARNRSETVYRDTISELHDNLKGAVGYTVTRNDTIDAVAQHLVLRPVFETLFGRPTNPVWQAFDHAVERLNFRVELAELEKWHDLMKYHVENITNAHAKQTVIAQIYSNFFDGFDKKQAKTIVYTPKEVVEFIVNSVQHVLREQFDSGFDRDDVRVLDPFAGTGIFLAKLMESGHLGKRLAKADMSFGENKLLAYYTACANLETTLEKLTGQRTQFDGGSYVDTFTIPPNWRSLKAKGRAHEQAEITDPLFRRVRGMRDRQRDAHIHVIMGNPPYSGAQSSYDDANPNVTYAELDKRIKEEYYKVTKAQRKSLLFDYYKRAIRWASDRIGESGIIGFITPSSWIEGKLESGIRASLQKEFTDVYCFDLRGDAKLQGEDWRREGGKIFGGSSREPTAITILVKNPAKTSCTIHYHDIGDYLSREQKLDMIHEFGDISNIPWEDPIDPDKHHDWLNQRGKLTTEWEGIDQIGSKTGIARKTGQTIFQNYTLGINTSRDSWAYNTSKSGVEANMRRHISYCMAQDLDTFDVKDTDPRQGKWTRGLTQKLKKLNPKFQEGNMRIALYRPFLKQHLYFDKTRCFNGEVGLVPKFFPDSDTKNYAIVVPDTIWSGGYSVFITDITPSLDIVRHSQCFPFHAYRDGGQKENITDWALRKYRTTYKDVSITKEDIFYYTYGVLHSLGFREKYQAFLKRGLPNIPMAPDFRVFERAGRALAKLHLNFETGPRHDLGEPLQDIPGAPRKIKFGKKNREGPGPKTTDDHSVLIIDGDVVYDSLPHIDYTVNGRTPVGWFVDRYKFKVDKKSQIENYPLKGKSGEEVRAIIERLVYVGVESDRIIASLPEEFEMGIGSEQSGLDKYAEEAQ